MVEGGWTCARVMTYLIRCLTWLNTLCTSSNTIFPSKGQPKYLNFNLQTCGKSMNNGISCQHWVAGGTDPASTASTNVPHRSLSLTVHTSPLKVQVQSQSITMPTANSQLYYTSYTALYISRPEVIMEVCCTQHMYTCTHCAWTINKPFPPLQPIHFSRYQVASAVLRWQGDGATACTQTCKHTLTMSKEVVPVVSSTIVNEL